MLPYIFCKIFGLEVGLCVFYAKRFIVVFKYAFTSHNVELTKKNNSSIMVTVY